MPITSIAAGIAPTNTNLQSSYDWYFNRQKTGSELLKAGTPALKNIAGGNYLNRKADLTYLLPMLNADFYGKPDTSMLKDTMEGKYMDVDRNPYLKSTYESALSKALPMMDTSAQNAGRYGSGVWASLKSQTAADLGNSIYGTAYERERGRQSDAINQAALWTEQSRMRGVEGQAGARKDITDLNEDAYQNEIRRQGEALGLLPKYNEAELNEAGQMLSAGESRQRNDQLAADRTAANAPKEAAANEVREQLATLENNFSSTRNPARINYLRDKLSAILGGYALPNPAIYSSTTTVKLPQQSN